MKTLLIASALVLMLAACSTPPGYQSYLTTQENIATANKSAANVQAIALQKIATTSTDPTVQAVAAMMLGMAAGRQPAQVIAPPQDPVLEWFKASTPLLGAFINGKYALEAQKDNNATQVELYSNQIGAFRDIAVEGIRKEPLPVIVVTPEGSAPVATE